MVHLPTSIHIINNCNHAIFQKTVFISLIIVNKHNFTAEIRLHDVATSCPFYRKKAGKFLVKYQFSSIIHYRFGLN